MLFLKLYKHDCSFYFQIMPHFSDLPIAIKTVMELTSVHGVKDKNHMLRADDVINILPMELKTYKITLR